ncbi:sororin [Centropristis striata]|uniref:sororin n=1 Tax=Centropristis striata TaxID=184440 RepID=UPI0027DF7361|nr:sororin [Centropristis striata]
MNEGTPRNIMSESNNLNGSQRRRSPRLSSPPTGPADNKMAMTAGAVKRRITVRKIAPRKTVAPSENNKENTPRRSGRESIQQKTPKVSTPDAVPERRGSTSAGKKKKKEAAILSPILPSSPPAASHPQQPQVDPEDAVWSQKVRRSYSRLSDKSFNSPNSRETLFGFEKLTTPEVRRADPSKITTLEVSGSFTGLNSFTSLLEAEDCGSALPDLNIPGVAVVKEKKRRRKVQQIDATELDALAAQMNAEFEEAEEFELMVE